MMGIRICMDIGVQYNLSSMKYYTKYKHKEQ